MQNQLSVKQHPTFPVTFTSIFVAIIATICAIDATLDETAEYFNAWVTVVKLTQWLHGQQPPTEHFLYG